MAGRACRAAVRPGSRYAGLAEARPSVRDLEAIATAFLQVDKSLEDLRDRHHAADEIEERDRVAGQQRLNEQAYFVLAWG